MNAIPDFSIPPVLIEGQRVQNHTCRLRNCYLWNIFEEKTVELWQFITNFLVAELQFYSLQFPMPTFKTIELQFCSLFFPDEVITIITPKLKCTYRDRCHYMLRLVNVVITRLAYHHCFLRCSDIGQEPTATASQHLTLKHTLLGLTLGIREYRGHQ